MKRDPLRLYISGPMTGIPKHNYPAFEAAYGRLIGEGHDVVSPHLQDYKDGLDHGQSPDGWTVSDEEYDALLERDYALIESVDGIVFLPGWEGSGGAGREGEMALKLGKQLFTFHPELGRRYGSSIIPLNVQRFKSLHTKKRVERDAA